MTKEDLFKITELAMSQTTAEEFKVLYTLADFTVDRHELGIDDWFYYEWLDGAYLFKMIHMEADKSVNAVFSLIDMGFIRVMKTKDKFYIKLDDDFLMRIKPHEDGIPEMSRSIMKNILKRQQAC